MTHSSQLNRILLKGIDTPQLHTLAVYQKSGGYSSLKEVLAKKEEEVIDIVKASGLRGRGGAGFPTGLKWSFVPKDVFPRYLVINADEGEPGTFKDRLLLHNNPHMLIEGIIYSSYALQVHTAFIYIRGEFFKEYLMVEDAVNEAYQAGLLGKDIAGTGFDLDVVVHRGAGAYICGEESALLESLEGRRGNPKLKPPFPAVKGVYEKPTVINNVETICAVPFILREGAEAYRQYGTEKSPGTKIFCISGHVEKPGNYEVPLGFSLKDFIYDIAGGVKDGQKLKAVIPGGSSTPMLPADAIDVALDYEALAGAGTMLGSGAIIVINEHTCIVKMVKRLIHFYKHESCGKCTPCREGTNWMAKIYDRLEKGEGKEGDIELLLDICDNISFKSFCPLGDAAVGPVVSSIKHFRDEYEAHIAGRHCSG